MLDNNVELFLDLLEEKMAFKKVYKDDWQKDGIYSGKANAFEYVTNVLKTCLKYNRTLGEDGEKRITAYLRAEIERVSKLPV